MTSKRRNSALWAYLEAKGVLGGSSEGIAAAKRAYWKEYHYRHRRAQRQDKPEFIVSLDRDDGTHSKIVRAAKKHKLTVSSFLRSATLAYLAQVYIVPDREYLARIESLLSECVNEIQALAGTKEKYYWQRENKIEIIEAKVERMEGQLAELFRFPLSVEDYLRKELARSPELKDRLLTFLKAYDRQAEIT